VDISALTLIVILVGLPLVVWLGVRLLRDRW
jgi:hypothetical protein